VKDLRLPQHPTSPRTLNVRFRSLHGPEIELTPLQRRNRKQLSLLNRALNMRQLCNQSHEPSVTPTIKRAARAAAIVNVTHDSASAARMQTRASASEESRRRSRGKRAHYTSNVRNSFTRLPKLSVGAYTCTYTCSARATNCRDAPTRTQQTTRKAQLTSCIYVANLMQLRRCEWRYVACAPPRKRFRDNSRINNPEGERV
jgi:hypothetical protein